MLEKVYVFHGYDEESEVGAPFWHGSSILLQRGIGSTWKKRIVRSRGCPPKGPTPYAVLNHGVVPTADADAYDSDDGEGGDEDLTF